MGHLDEDELLRFVQHQLSPETLARAEAHLRSCGLCRRAVAVLAETEVVIPDPLPSPWPATPSHPAGARPARRGKQIDRYVVLDVLGAGSMGVVYAAFDPELDRKIALKMLAGNSDDPASDEEKRARMMREAQAMARLSHPNVVHVHDVGSFQDHIFLAMEFVEGQSLGKWLQERRRTWREVLRVFIQAGRGLAAAHAAGLVHRDFKPDNVMVGGDGVARVMDFGLVSSASAAPDSWTRPAPPPPPEPGAEARTEAEAELSITRSGALLGTPAYMAPEQWSGQKIDHRADQFSFCVSLYEALHGQRPFEAKTMAELTSRVAQGRIREVPAGSPVPFLVRHAVGRGLSADPARRYPSMTALLERLELGLRIPRRPLLLGAAAATLLVAIGLLAPGPWRHRAPERCGQASGAFAAAWDNEPERQAFSRALAGAGVPAAAESWVHAERFVDVFRDRWTASRDRACADADASPELTRARVACLDRQMDELRALRDVLRATDPSEPRDAAMAAARLPSPEDCAGRRVVDEEPEDGRGREVRGQLARARMAMAAGAPTEALRLARDALARARGVSRNLEAEALLALGAAEAASGEASRAQATLSRAMVSAEAAGHAAAGAEAAVALAELLEARGPPGQAEFFSSLASAELERLGEEGPLRARVEIANARRLMDGRGRAVEDGAEEVDGLDEAEVALRRAVAILRRVHGEEHPEVARALGLRGRVKQARGKLKEALGDHRLAVKLLERSLGRNHPAVARALLGEARVQLALGDARAAIALCERAVELSRSTGGGALVEAEAALEEARRGTAGGGQ